MPKVANLPISLSAPAVLPKILPTELSTLVTVDNTGGTGLVGYIEASQNPAALPTATSGWFNVPGIRTDDFLTVDANGASGISVPDGSVRTWVVPSLGACQVRFRPTAIGTAGAGVTLASFAVAAPVPSPRAAATAIGVAGAITAIAGVMSNTEVTQMGSAAVAAALGQFREEGNIAVVTGNPVAGNGADTTDDVLVGFRIPANVFDQAYRQLMLQFHGLTGATTNNKRFKVWVAPTYGGTQTVTNGVISGGSVSSGTLILDSGAWVNGTTPNNAVAFAGQVCISKYGANGSNTQMSAYGQTILGATHGGAYAASALTLTESGTIDIVITGSSYTTGAANDLKLQAANLTGSN